MLKFNKTAVLGAILCAAALSCDKVDNLSDDTTVDSFSVTGISPKGVVVEKVEIIPSAGNHDDNKIVIHTDAINEDYPVSVTVDVKYSGAEKIFFLPSKGGSMDWDFSDPLVFSKGEKYKFVLVAESGLVNTYTISLTDNATGGGDYLDDLFQLPNSDFSKWVNLESTKINIDPTGIEGNNYWCTANNFFVQGTHPVNTPPTSGAVMVTKKVDFVYRTIAAGTTFTGNFSSVVNLDNPKQMTFFGSRFIQRPKSVTFRMSYKAGDQLQKVENNKFVNLPGKDRGQAWIELLQYTGTGDIEYHKDPTANVKVLGSAELEINDSNGWVEVTLNINYTDTTTQPTHIAIVFTSSIRGDYFEGAPGSTLMINDVRLNYHNQ